MFADSAGMNAKTLRERQTERCVKQSGEKKTVKIPSSTFFFLSLSGSFFLSVCVCVISYFLFCHAGRYRTYWRLSEIKQSTTDITHKHLFNATLVCSVVLWQQQPITHTNQSHSGEVFSDKGFVSLFS